MKSIVNQLCNEFMNDIIRITNTAEDDGDPAALESYLVKDRGWLLLYVIYKNGIQVGLFFIKLHTETFKDGSRSSLWSVESTCSYWLV